MIFLLIFFVKCFSFAKTIPSYEMYRTQTLHYKGTWMNMNVMSLQLYLVTWLFKDHHNKLQIHVLFFYIKWLLMSEIECFKGEFELKCKLHVPK